MSENYNVVLGKCIKFKSLILVTLCSSVARLSTALFICSLSTDLSLSAYVPKHRVETAAGPIYLISVSESLRGRVLPVLCFTVFSSTLLASLYQSLSVVFGISSTIDMIFVARLLSKSAENNTGTCTLPS